MTITTFGERIKHLRKQQKLTQVQLSGKIEVKQGTYSRWENNTLEPDLENIVKLSNFFNVSTDYLLGNTIYSKQDWQPLDVFDISDIKNFDKAQLDKLKFSIMFEITRNKIKALELKGKLIKEYKLDDAERNILNTIFTEVALEMQEYYNLG